MQKKILFILSGNLSTTPRAIKNIQLAIQHYQVNVVKVNRVQTWDNLDKELAKSIGIHPVSVSLGRKPLGLWMKTTIIHTLSKPLAKIFKKSLKIQAYASQKIFVQITDALNKIDPMYDLIIGQGSGTLYPVYAYSKKHNIPFAFDAEDYHPGETNNPKQKKRTEYLLKKILPKAAYISCASPLIGKHTLELLDNPHPKHFLINNSFPTTEFIQPNQHINQSAHHPKLRFVWFSQNIAHGRGLEQIIEAIEPLKNQIELHVIGNLYESFNKNWIAPYNDFIKTYQPMSQQELHKKLSEFDIGLALEPKKDLNNDLAISNKIFAYAQAGLYILATDTQGQRQFMEENPWSGMLCELSKDEMQKAIKYMINNISKIRENAHDRYQQAKALAWENESGKLLEAWRGIMEEEAKRVKLEAKSKEEG